MIDSPALSSSVWILATAACHCCGCLCLVSGPDICHCCAILATPSLTDGHHCNLGFTTVFTPFPGCATFVFCLALLHNKLHHFGICITEVRHL
jgi:hypothetical protein